MPEQRLRRCRDAYKEPAELRGPYYPNFRMVPCDMCGESFYADLWGDQKPPYFCREHLAFAPWRRASSAYRITQAQLASERVKDERL